TFQYSDTGGNPALHVEHTASGDIVPALKIGESLFLVRCERSTGKICQKRFQQGVRFKSQMLQIAIIAGFQHIEMASQRQSPPSPAANDRDDILGHRGTMTVDDGNIVVIFLEIGNLAQELGKLGAERCLVRCSGFAWPFHHAIGEFSHPFRRIPFIGACHGLSSLNSSPSPYLGQGTDGSSQSGLASIYWLRCFLRNALVLSFSGLVKITSGLPSSTTTPLSMNSTLSETSAAKRISWVTISMVICSCASCFMT